MSLKCNMLKDCPGIDWGNPDPESDFIVEQVECGRPALYGERNYAGAFSDTLACPDCYAAMKDPVDWWPLKPEYTVQSKESMAGAVNRYDELVAMLQQFVECMVPHPTEHPTMYAAWSKGHQLLGKLQVEPPPEQCPLCEGLGRVLPCETPDPPSDDGGWNDATRANLEAMRANERNRFHGPMGTLDGEAHPTDVGDDVLNEAERYALECIHESKAGLPFNLRYLLSMVREIRRYRSEHSKDLCSLEALPPVASPEVLERRKAEARHFAAMVSSEKCGRLQTEVLAFQARYDGVQFSVRVNDGPWHSVMAYPPSEEGSTR